MSLLLPLAACEGFPGFGSREPVVAPIVIEVPVPTVQPGPEPEEPKPPLPAKKPLAALQAKRDQGANGHAATNEGTPAAPAGAPAEGELQTEPPPAVIGLNRSALIGQFGSPVAEREAAPARVLEFVDGDCELAAYLYFDTARNDFYVLQYQVNGMTDRNEAADRCLMRIRDAARR